MIHDFARFFRGGVHGCAAVSGGSGSCMVSARVCWTGVGGTAGCARVGAGVAGGAPGTACPGRLAPGNGWPGMSAPVGSAAAGMS
ncbi:hypothetical protein PJN93_30200, partial [Mycobacterium kansasii]